jgi:hypothetical protein
MDKNYAYIRFTGTHNVSEITQILELEPTRSWNVGDNRKDGSNYNFSFWSYESEIFEKEFIDEAICEVINFIEPISEKFKLLPSYFKPVLMCVGYHEKSFSGFVISKETIEKLYLYGLDLEFDLYCHANKNG